MQLTIDDQRKIANFIDYCFENDKFKSPGERKWHKGSLLDTFRTCFYQVNDPFHNEEVKVKLWQIIKAYKKYGSYDFDEKILKDDF